MQILDKKSSQEIGDAETKSSYLKFGTGKLNNWHILGRLQKLECSYDDYLISAVFSLLNTFSSCMDDFFRYMHTQSTPFQEAVNIRCVRVYLVLTLNLVNLNLRLS